MEKVKTEVKTRLDLRQEILTQLGPERAGTMAQMAYLTTMATHFQRIVTLALSANYGADDIFNDQEDLRLAPAFMARMKLFSTDVLNQGQTYMFLPEDPDAPIGEEQEQVDSVDDKRNFSPRKSLHGEQLFGIQYSIEYKDDKVARTKKDGVKPWLRKIFHSHRGFELGTFNGAILATAMKKQSAKWTNLSLGLVSDSIVTVHKFILAALEVVCSDGATRLALERTLIEDLLKRYEVAIANTKFLLKVESSISPATMNHYFNDELQKSRRAKLVASMKAKKVTSNTYGQVVRLEDIKTQVNNMSNDEYAVLDIHDILKSYYKVSRKTFVDNVCNQAASYSLLHCEDSPIALFSPIWVSQLSSMELEEIAGEAPIVRRSRIQVTKEVESLREAMKILARN